ncbi:50S ribosomal protein L1 [Pseudovirgaria hyperparasitica]|uniref:50S ribosomal protein L1 n=1 Tax=Pseudovirgaria hyperparasitica TaxID=470096 RepID=A0A6A6VW91_9PEZI|nr:50S ribosomal protein L1 [Pseudovirgaria hyperparasitica]KAF2754056.1 50S ribosomal protein L1 [Pseudovirgaria hyperparasitica]
MTTIPSGAARLSSSATRCVFRQHVSSCPASFHVSQQVRRASMKKELPGKKKNDRKHFLVRDLKDAEQFALTDAVQYLRCFEIGKDQQRSKYELHVKINTLKSGPTIKNRIKLPNSVRSDMRIAVICDPESKQGIASRKAGAHIVGEESIFEDVRQGRIDFDRVICHTNSVQKLNAAKVARILGPKGLMPSVKSGTVTTDCAGLIKGVAGASEYKERMGVIRLPIGQLRFTPEQLSTNVRFFLAALKRDIAAMNDSIQKSIHEVVLSTTQGPGISLNGDYRSSQSLREVDFIEKPIPAYILSDIVAFDTSQKSYKPPEEVTKGISKDEEAT